MALVAAVAVEVRDDARDLGQHAATAALVGCAEGSIVFVLDPIIQRSLNSSQKTDVECLYSAADGDALDRAEGDTVQGRGQAGYQIGR